MSKSEISATTPDGVVVEGQDSAMATKIPNLVDAIEKNHFKIIPVKDGEGNVTDYDISSRGGTLLFQVSREDMAFAVVKDTILNAAADKEEITATFDIVEGVQRSLSRLGMTDDEIPRTPHEIAQQVITLMGDFGEIQKAKSKLDIQNNFQAFLAMSQRVFAGGKEEWGKLAPAQQRWMLVFGDTLLVEALRGLGVNKETAGTSETIKQIAVNLVEMRREASWYTTASRALSGIRNGMTGFIFGDDETKGLLPGVIQSASDATGEAIDHAADLAGRAKKGLGFGKKDAEGNVEGNIIDD